MDIEFFYSSDYPYRLNRYILHMKCTKKKNNNKYKNSQYDNFNRRMGIIVFILILILFFLLAHFSFSETK